MPVPVRQYNSNSYNFGYQGSLKDDEISGSGNHYTTEFRELETRLGRWWSLDPKSSFFAWQSPFVSMNNNPILLNDVLGDSAWSYKNKWDDKFISKYREFSATKTEEYKKNGSNFTCEDYALSIAVDFASQNNLPFQFTNETGTFDPTSDVYTNVDQFKSAIQEFSGANDLANSKNTSETNIKDAQKGDIILLKLDKDNPKFNHTQVITKTTSSQVDINQGGLFGRAFANSPKNTFYGGKELSQGSYYKGKNSYYNKTKMEYHQGDFLQQNKATVRTWNFLNWNGK